MFYSISIQYYLCAKEKNKHIIFYQDRFSFSYSMDFSRRLSCFIESECHHQNLFVLYYDDIDTSKIFY